MSEPERDGINVLLINGPKDGQQIYGWTGGGHVDFADAPPPLTIREKPSRPAPTLSIKRHRYVEEGPDPGSGFVIFRYQGLLG